jgi:hypothetical protein
MKTIDILAQPDFSLVAKHNEYIKGWKLDVISFIQNEYEKTGHFPPKLFLVGYDYQNKTYREMVSKVQLYQDQPTQEKYLLYVFLKNIASNIPFHPLAMVLASPSLMEKEKKDGSIEKGTVITAMYQTRLTFKRYVFVGEETITEVDGNMVAKKVLVQNKDLETQYAGPEFMLFESLFCLDLTRN